MNRITLFFTFFLLLFSLVACQPKQPVAVSSSMQAEKLDVLESTAVITKSMMQTSIFAGTQVMPKIVIGKITNSTGDDKLSIHKVEDIMKAEVVKSRKAKILPYEAFEFDYTTHAVIDYVKNQNNSQTETREYSIRLQLLNYYGELVGEWSAEAANF